MYTFVASHLSAALVIRVETQQSGKAVRLSPDGRLLATTSVNETLRIWDAQSGQLLVQKSKYGRGLLLKFSPDSRLLLRRARLQHGSRSLPLGCRQR